MTEGPPEIDGEIIAELLADGATAHKHPSGSCVVLTLLSGPPPLMLSCNLMDRLVGAGLLTLEADGEYRHFQRRGR